MLQYWLCGGPAFQRIPITISIPESLECFIITSRLGDYKKKHYTISNTQESNLDKAYDEKDTEEIAVAFQERNHLNGASQEAIKSCHEEILQIVERCQSISKKQDNRPSSFDHQWLSTTGGPSCSTICFRAAVSPANGPFGRSNNVEEVIIQLPVSTGILRGIYQLTCWTYNSCLALHCTTKHIDHLENQQHTGPETVLEKGNGLLYSTGHQLCEDVFSSPLSGLSMANYKPSWFATSTQQAMHASKCSSLGPTQIRLIDLLPGGYSDPINYKMTIVDLENPPEYEVISYVLATSSNTIADCRIIDCGGRTANSTSKILAEYGSILRRIRCRSNRKLLWMDALCVIGNGNFGVDSQVQLMPRIYRSATKIEVFVGRAIGSSNVTLDKIENLSSTFIQKGPEPAKDTEMEVQSASTKEEYGFGPTAMPPNPNRKRKADDLQQREEDEDEDSDEKDRHTGAAGTKDKEKQYRRLACPYFKRRPENDPKTASCIYPGYQTIARLKEHLYRHHMRPIYCPRCYKTFDNDGQMAEHLTAIERCPQNPKPPTIEGISKEQAAQLKSKKRQKGANSQEEKWKTIYQILFPEDLDKTVPSPFCEHDATFAYRQPLPSSGKLASVFNSYSKQKLADALKHNIKQGQKLPDAINKSVDEWFSDLWKEVKPMASEPMEELEALHTPTSPSLRASRNGSMDSTLTPAFNSGPNGILGTSKHTTGILNERPKKVQKSSSTDSVTGLQMRLNNKHEGQETTHQTMPKGASKPDGSIP